MDLPGAAPRTLDRLLPAAAVARMPSLADLFRCTLLIVVADHALRSRSLEVACRRVRSWAQRSGAAGTDASPAELALLLRRIGNRLPRLGTCLRRSIVLEAVLCSQGRESALRIGVRRQGEGIAAHAWVELDGVALGEDRSALESFAVLEAGASLPPLDWGR